jgi:DNA-binding CsgD family transcriptional regulator/predicted negative regulator of RcsB-dependent stress response
LVGDGEELVRAAQEALANGDWADALDLLSRVDGEDPGLLDGRATARWWLGDIPAAFEEWEAAYSGYVAAGDVPEAFTVAISLSLLYQANLGNWSLSKGWAARARRFAESVGDPVFDGWVALADVATCDDQHLAETLAERALAAGRAAGDRSLELCALASVGAARIRQGRVEDGAPLMDEALAASLGGEADLDTVVFTSCLLMQCCSVCADFERVGNWTRALAPFVSRYGCPYVDATCKAHYGAVLVETGRWDEAEQELRAALALAADALPAVRAKIVAFLADLRLAQGRIDEARRLAEAHEGASVVVAVHADVMLAAGEPRVAASMVARRLDHGVSDPIEAARLREALGNALLASDDVAGAASLARLLGDEAATETSEVVAARAHRLAGRVALESGSPDAVRELDRALVTFADLGMTYQAARTRGLLAEALATSEPDAAIDQATKAFEALDALRATRDADSMSSWLRAYGVTVGRRGPRASEVLTRREQEVLIEVAAGRSNPEIAERLYISRRTVEHHVSNALAKLALRNRAELAAWATQEGLADK